MNREIKEFDADDAELKKANKKTGKGVWNAFSSAEQHENWAKLS